MYFDALTAAAVADELRETVLGGFVQKLVLPDPNSVAMEVYARRQRYQLLLTIHPTHSRVCLLAERPTAAPGLVTPFGLLLRKYVLDGAIDGIDQPAGERIIALSIIHRANTAHRTDTANSHVWLQAELMGRHGNLLLLDGDRTKVVESSKRVSPQMSRVRPIGPQRPYVPPPARPGVAPHRVTPDGLRELAARAKPEAALWQTLLSGVQGLSPLAAREVAFRAGAPRDACIADWSDWTKLAVEVRRLAALWATRDWKPCVATAEAGNVLAYAPYELTHLAGEAELSFPGSMSLAIAGYTGASPEVVSHGQLRAQILAALDRRIAQVGAQLQSLERQAAGSEGAERLMEDGQMVLAYAYSLEPGAARLELDDRTIELDPALSPSEYAQQIFEEYRRRRRAAEGVPDLIRKTQEELDTLHEYRTYANLAEGHAELSALRAEALAAGVIREAAGGGKLRKDPTPKMFSRVAPDGTRILAGKSVAQNARVLEAASGDDWWFHGREIPGGHVIARTGGREPSRETLLIAAETAAFYSSARESSSVEVIYTQCKYVRKIKGAGPGQVTYRNERSISVTPRDHFAGAAVTKA